MGGTAEHGVARPCNLEPEMDHGVCEAARPSGPGAATDKRAAHRGRPVVRAATGVQRAAVAPVISVVVLVLVVAVAIVGLIVVVVVVQAPRWQGALFVVGGACCRGCRRRGPTAPTRPGQPASLFGR